MTTELYASLMNVSTETALLSELVAFSENLGFNQACAVMLIRKAGSSRFEAKVIENYQQAWKAASRVSTAIANDLKLATGNQKHFSRINGLRLFEF